MFSQCFGDAREANSDGMRTMEREDFTKFTIFILADNVSALAFDNSGKYLATGDNAGRVVLFNRNEHSNSGSVGLFFSLRIDHMLI
jgi:hypothetical protein